MIQLLQSAFENMTIILLNFSLLYFTNIFKNKIYTPVNYKCTHKAFSPRHFHGYCLNEFIIRILITVFYLYFLSSLPSEMALYTNYR